MFFPFLRAFFICTTTRCSQTVDAFRWALRTRLCKPLASVPRAEAAAVLVVHSGGGHLGGNYTPLSKHTDVYTLTHSPRGGGKLPRLPACKFPSFHLDPLLWKKDGELTHRGVSLRGAFLVWRWANSSRVYVHMCTRFSPPLGAPLHGAHAHSPQTGCKMSYNLLKEIISAD